MNGIITSLSKPLGGDASPFPHLLKQEAEALAFLIPLSGDYPNIERWFRFIVVPGLRTGSRTLLRIERDGDLVGLGIAKNEPNERKICTVRIAPSHIGRGIGVRIFDALLRWLECDRPHLTVSSAKLPAFERIFDYYGFEITSTQNGRYLPNACEIGYNEPSLLGQAIASGNGHTYAEPISALRDPVDRRR